jgi:HK97 family phage major capsid protein
MDRNETERNRLINWREPTGWYGFDPADQRDHLEADAHACLVHARKLVEAAEQEDRDLDPSEDDKYTRLRMQARRLDLRADELCEAHGLARTTPGNKGWATTVPGDREQWRSGGRPVGAGGEGGVVIGRELSTGAEIRGYAHGEKIQVRFREDHREFEGASVGRMIQGLVTGNWSGAEREKRAMSVGSNSAGGYLVPEPLSADLIDLARNEARLVQAGAITIPMEHTTLAFARQLTDPVAGWKAENEPAAVSNLSFDRVELKARTLAVIVRMSRELFDDAPNAADAVRNALAQALALELDRVGLYGVGSSTEPQGIAGATGIQEHENVGELSDYVPFSQASEMVENVNGEPRALILAPKTWYELDRLTDLEGRPLTPPPSWENLDVLRTNQVRTDQGGGEDEAEAYLGDFRNVMIGNRMNLEIAVSEHGAVDGESSFERYQVLIRAVLRADIALARPAELVHITGIQSPAES